MITIKAIRDYKEKEGVVLENELRKNDLNNKIIEDRQTMVLSLQNYNARLQEYRTSLTEQLGEIRKAYLAFQKSNILLAPSNGYVSLRNDLVDREMASTGEVLVYLTP